MPKSKKLQKDADTSLRAARRALEDAKAKADALQKGARRDAKKAARRIEKQLDSARSSAEKSAKSLTKSASGAAKAVKKNVDVAKREVEKSFAGAPAPASEDLAALTLPQLRERARAAGLTGYSRLSKPALVSRLQGS